MRWGSHIVYYDQQQHQFLCWACRLLCHFECWDDHGTGPTTIRPAHVCSMGQGTPSNGGHLPIPDRQWMRFRAYCSLLAWGGYSWDAIEHWATLHAAAGGEPHRKYQACIIRNCSSTCGHASNPVPCAVYEPKLYTSCYSCPTALCWWTTPGGPTARQASSSLPPLSKLDKYSLLMFNFFRISYAALYFWFCTLTSCTWTELFFFPLM